MDASDTAGRDSWPVRVSIMHMEVWRLGGLVKVQAGDQKHTCFLVCQWGHF